MRVVDKFTRCLSLQRRRLLATGIGPEVVVVCRVVEWGELLLYTPSSAGQHALCNALEQHAL